MLESYEASPEGLDLECTSREAVAAFDVDPIEIETTALERHDVIREPTYFSCPSGPVGCGGRHHRVDEQSHSPLEFNPEIVAMAPSLASDADALTWTQSAPRAQLWGEISQPTLVLLGEETLPIMPPAADQILAAVPNSTRQIIRASGHGWDADVMVELLAGFVA